MGDIYIYWGDCGVWRRDGGNREEGWVKYIYTGVTVECVGGMGGDREEGWVWNVKKGWVGTGDGCVHQTVTTHNILLPLLSREEGWVKYIHTGVTVEEGWVGTERRDGCGLGPDWN